MKPSIPGLPIAEREQAAVRELHRQGILHRDGSGGWHPIEEQHFPALARLLKRYNLERLRVVRAAPGATTAQEYA
jgi:hypothetical protein